MSSFRTARVGEAFSEIVTVFDLDGYTPVSDQVADDFTVRIYKDGALADPAPDVSIAEIGDTGDYHLQVAGGFSAKGLWTITVVTELNSATWRYQIEVSEHSVDDIYDVFVSGGSGTETVVLTVVDTAHDDAPVPDMLVNIFNEAETAFITYGRTDASGELTVFLDVGSYALRLYKPGVSVSPTSLEVTGGGTELEIEVESVAIEPPADPQLCRLYADFLTQGGLPKEDFRIFVTNLQRPDASSSAALAVVDKSNTYTTDSLGHVQFDAVRGTRLRVSFVGTKLSRDIIVPDQPAANLLTLFGARPDQFAVVRAG